jgi:hypothetical protein
MLVSRDEKSCLVVSYREVKKCIDSAFRCGFTPPLRATIHNECLCCFLSQGACAGPGDGNVEIAVTIFFLSFQRLL